MRQHHPRCPACHAHPIILRVLSKRHEREITLGEAVGLEMQNYIRHELTNYDKKLGAGGEKADCRAAIKDKIRRIIAKWDRPKADKAEKAQA